MINETHPGLIKFKGPSHVSSNRSEYGLGIVSRPPRDGHAGCVETGAVQIACIDIGILRTVDIGILRTGDLR